MRTRIAVLVLGACTALALGGCASRVHGLSGSASDQPALETPVSDIVTVADPCAPAVEPCAPVAAPRYTARAVPDACCGLPCERGCASWHVRGVVGVAFPLGDDIEGEARLYFGADVGWTSACCWGVDVFYRRHCGQLDREFPVAGAPTLIGNDGGHFQHVGVKLTYESSINNSPKWSWYVGAGPQFFWADDYLVEDDGIGAFAELGVAYSVNRSLRIRAGVEVLAQDTNVGHTTPALDGESRLVWFVAPVVQAQFDF